jgi:glycosyltransferase involved in cell wall biosynthesis
MSVVIPLYNQRATVHRCLESVLRQTFRDFEALVVDDGSTDGSGDIAREFADPRVRVIRQPNGGVRRRGIAGWRKRVPGMWRSWTPTTNGLRNSSLPSHG